jgi:hypothetical protein
MFKVKNGDTWLICTSATTGPRGLGKYVTREGHSGLYWLGAQEKVLIKGRVTSVNKPYKKKGWEDLLANALELPYPVTVIDRVEELMLLFDPPGFVLW